MHAHLGLLRVGALQLCGQVDAPVDQAEQLLLESQVGLRAHQHTQMAAIVGDVPADVFDDAADAVGIRPFEQLLERAVDPVDRVLLDVAQQTVEIRIVGVERGSVHVGPLAQLAHGDSCERLVRQQFDECIAQRPPRVLRAAALDQLPCHGVSLAANPTTRNPTVGCQTDTVLVYWIV